MCLLQVHPIGWNRNIESWGRWNLNLLQLHSHCPLWAIQPVSRSATTQELAFLYNVSSLRDATEREQLMLMVDLRVCVSLRKEVVWRWVGVENNHADLAILYSPAFVSWTVDIRRSCSLRWRFWTQLDRGGWSRASHPYAAARQPVRYSCPFSSRELDGIDC